MASAFSAVSLATLILHFLAATSASPTAQESKPAKESPKSPSIHHHMDKDMLRSVFHVESHDEVPEYEVVRVWKRPLPGPAAGAGEHRVLLAAFGRPLRLHLRPHSGLLSAGRLRVWEATAGNGSADVTYTELPQDADEEPLGDVFQDEDNQAALLLRRDAADGKLLLEGTIGHDLVVKPVPAAVRQHLGPSVDDDEMFLDAEGEDLEDDVAVTSGFPLGINATADRSPRAARELAAAGVHPHIVYRRAGGHHRDDLSDYAFMEPDRLAKRYHRRTTRSVSKREAPYVIYPEILVIVDYDGYRLHGGDNVQIKRYFVSFWNGVDLRYKLLKGPKIRISIAGIIISRGRDATPYLERNRVGRDAIDSAAALTDMGKYLFRERRLPVYDIAVAVTKLDMCRRQFANDVCNRGTAGFAYVGGACVVNKRLEKVNSVAIIEDTGGFSGIIVGAHEVGHLLGAVHDGSPPPSYLGGPGAEKCRWEDGYIMSDLRHTEKGFRWSSCSVASFHHFLNGDTATCLYNSPHEDESLPRVLPGKLLTLDAQCRKDRGTSACFKDDRVCAQLFCFDSGSGYCVAYRPAAEGSSCGDGQYCLNGRCVAEHENIIPDYSQNTASYIRRSDSDSAATQSRPVYAALPNSTTQRSAWQDIWSTGSSSTPLPPTVSQKYPFYTQKTTSTNSQQNYNYYHTTKSVTNYTTPTTKTVNNFYQFFTTTPRSTYSFGTFHNFGSTKSTYGDYHRSKFGSSTTPNPYNSDSKYTDTNRNPHNLNSYHQSYSSTSYSYHTSTTTTSTTPRPTYFSAFKNHGNFIYQNPVTTTNKYPPYFSFAASSYHQIVSNSTNDQAPNLTHVGDTECIDKVTNLSGSLTCHEFLTRYGYQYCSHQYLRESCCASHKTICRQEYTRS
ncbi:A disintegrin and metalloproteinase with thrombospondin motifs 1 [Schistocerca americana]|uniref:A disintegrin and metalloproteinase with thrombospondin motifs 1 n=1 Tax=Schistocerca americana TaxID=7009 RepID=UPI001F500451|nr:A disintegrin and metalloproteinase with thrombospondin motifs 1 [Schistocerca americana]